MKNQFSFLLMAVFLCMVLFSCSGDDGTETPVPLAENASNQVKWVADNESGRFASIEFSKSGNYIVVENVPEKSTVQRKIHFGTYKITDLTTISLSDIGIIKVKNVTDNALNVEIILDGTSTPFIFTGTKSDNMKATAKTDLLCRTWEIIKYNGEDTAGTEYEGATVLFSKAGTYFVFFPNGGEENDGGLALWKWKEGTGESQFLYSWSDTFEGDYEGSFVTINSLSSTSLIITEEFVDEGDEIDVWELKPVANR